MRRKFLRAALTAMMIAMGGEASFAQQQTVNIGKLDWPSAGVMAHILKSVIEKDLGAKVELQPGTYIVMYEAMHRGKGDIDVDPQTWYPNHAAVIKKYVEEERTVELNKRPYEATQGLCVTKLTAEKYGIKDVHQLVSVEVSKLFDTDGDGRGELWIGPKGWGSTNGERAKAHSYGYDEFFELTTLDQTQGFLALDKAVRGEKPFVFYCYAPSHQWLLWDLVWLDEPATDTSKWKMLTPDDDPDWINKSTVGMRWPPAQAYIAFSASLRQRAPAVADFLSNVAFETKDVTQWDYDVSVGKQEMEDVARKWVEGNPGKVKQWLGTAP